MPWFAHSENNSGKKHTMKDHLQAVCNFATRSPLFAKQKEFASFMHDLGKYLDGFQVYLAGNGKSVPHSLYGGIMATIFGSEVASRCICGHHGGLHNRTDWNQMVESNKETDELLETLYGHFEEDTGLSLLGDYQNLDENLQRYNESEKDFITRYIFSSLTDADWLDTERHFNHKRFDARSTLKLDIQQIHQMIEQVKEYIKERPYGPMSPLRNEVREFAISHSSHAPGFFSLNLPTGLGKTLTSFLWALKHAEKHSFERIIIVLPYTNIIDQTVQTLTNIVGEENILAHHSAVIDTAEDDEQKYDYKKLASENWDYPIIVTTSVQFFESLFSNKPFKCRKLHNLEKSIVIFDEVQSLPKDLAEPTIQMLKDVQAILGTSFLFCTATMPAFNKREKFDGIEKIISLVKEPEFLFQKTRRVRYELINNLDEAPLTDISDLADKSPGSTLAVLNTKKDARKLFNLVKNQSGWDKIYHLSTNMCADHRIKVINAIRKDLENNRKNIEKKRIFVASTQLIEAGVDFDFPVVLRALAPLESIIQAAGRCNREGGAEGVVYIFESGTKPPGEYKQGAQVARTLIREDQECLHRAEGFENYYRQMTDFYIKGNKVIQKARLEKNFKTVADNYRLIDDKVTSVFIQYYTDKNGNKHVYDEEINEFFEKIKKNKFLNRDEMRKLQPYMVGVRNSKGEYNQYIDCLTSGLCVWLAGYDLEIGITTDLNTFVD